MKEEASGNDSRSSMRPPFISPSSPCLSLFAFLSLFSFFSFFFFFFSACLPSFYSPFNRVPIIFYSLIFDLFIVHPTPVVHLLSNHSPSTCPSYTYLSSVLYSTIRSSSNHSLSPPPSTLSPTNHHPTTIKNLSFIRMQSLSHTRSTQPSSKNSAVT